MGNVYSLLLRMQNGSLNARWAWHICWFQHFRKRYRLLPWIKVEIERNGAETIVKYCSRKFCMSHLLHWYTLREGLGTAKLFVGVTGNNVTVNNKGGATCNNTKQLLQASSLVISWFKFTLLWTFTGYHLLSSPFSTSPFIINFIVTSYSCFVIFYS